MFSSFFLYCADQIFVFFSPNIFLIFLLHFYRTRVRSLFTLVTHSLTHSLTDSVTLLVLCFAMVLVGPPVPWVPDLLVPRSPGLQVPRSPGP